MIKIAFLFAGQGAQFVGMGKDLAEQYPLVHALFEHANALLGYDLASLCLTGPEVELTKTEHAQPGIFLVSWAAYQVFKEIAPQVCGEAAAGLSLGEFTALTAAGVMSFADGLRVVRQRGLLMQEACEKTKGAMAAIVGLDPAIVQAICEQTGVEIANLNCPGQIVISGDHQLIDRACEFAKKHGAKRAIILQVAGAFHSKLMASAQPRLRLMLQEIPLQSPSINVISNVQAKPHGQPEEIRQRLIEQVTASVHWEASMRFLLSQGFTHFIEFGPGTALTGFMRRIDRSATIYNVADSRSLQATASAFIDGASQQNPADP